jgi:hypothetical protein
MVGETQGLTFDQNEKIHASVDDFNGLIYCEPATLARPIGSRH